MSDSWHDATIETPPLDVLLIASDERGNRSLCFYSSEQGWHQAEFRPVVAWVRCPEFLEDE